MRQRERETKIERDRERKKRGRETEREGGRGERERERREGGREREYACFWFMCRQPGFCSVQECICVSIHILQSCGSQQDNVSQRNVLHRQREREADRQTDRQTARVTENHQTCRCKVLRKCYMGNLGLHVKSINNYKKKQKNQVVGF